MCPVMPRRTQPSRRPLVERLVGGDLAGVLQKWRDDELTLDEMAARMGAEHDIEVSRETIRRWCHELGVRIDGDRAGAA